MYGLFPASIRSCIKAFAIIRKWFISKIVFPKLGLRPRQSRLERLLQAVEISRIRNSDSTSSTPISEKPCVRSFVEAVLTSALLSPESRLHARAWQNVANARRTTADSFSALLDSSNAQTSTGDSLLVDIGWLFERILEVIVMPNVVTPPVDEVQGLVNFEKRRYDGSPHGTRVRLILFEGSCVIWPRMPRHSVRSLAKGDAKLDSRILLDLVRLNRRRATFNSTTVSFVRMLSVKPGVTALIQTRESTDHSTSWFLLNRRSINETGMLATG